MTLEVRGVFVGGRGSCDRGPTRGFPRVAGKVLFLELGCGYQGVGFKILY